MVKAKKKVELNPELKAMVDTKIAELSNEELAQVETYITTQRKQREKYEKEFIKLKRQVEALGPGYTIVKKPDTEEDALKEGEEVPREASVEAAETPVEVPAEAELPEPPAIADAVYRHPDDPTQTWTAGHGRRPSWLKKLIAEGHTMEELRVKEEEVGRPPGEAFV
jgi:DNA-binding protein H-NS